MTANNKGQRKHLFRLRVLENREFNKDKKGRELFAKNISDLQKLQQRSFARYEKYHQEISAQVAIDNHEKDLKAQQRKEMEDFGPALEEV
jgi:hypothetical protein